MMLTWFVGLYKSFVAPRKWFKIVPVSEEYILQITRGVK